MKKAGIPKANERKPEEEKREGNLSQFHTQNREDKRGNSESVANPREQPKENKINRTVVVAAGPCIAMS